MITINNGDPFPLGATLTKDGVNFCVYSKHCTKMQLLLFDQASDGSPSQVLTLHRRHNRTFHYWHIFVPGLTAGQHYAFRADGPFSEIDGLCFNADAILLDPYGKAVAVPETYRRQPPCDSSAAIKGAMKSVVADLSAYDWGDDRPLRRPFSETIIYEMHVRGFTQHASSLVSDQHRGTYQGVVEKIPYLQQLGVTAVELLPVFQFDAQDAPGKLNNYWGYNPVSFFSPHAAYASSHCPLKALDDFRDMVKALHLAGIEVILDVVYNHTAEGGSGGPTFCFKGFQNDAYYILTRDAAGQNEKTYANYSGCGNTLNANHAIVRRLILDSLRYWVQEMHVDGFRFDLASILSRDINGEPQTNPPILWDIETDPVLSGTKLIAEAWDAAGLYQVGDFFGERWKEWNGRFRDDVRSFVKGDQGFAGCLAQRFLASPDIFGHRNREPEQSVNFITSHDGFTLNDLVSYNEKHNLANGEGNRDGHNENLSWNCGVEGPTNDAKIESLRLQQIRNLITINLLSFGVPMLVMGDEVRRTQHGNNNAYCQDSELSWLDWDLMKENSGLFRFVQKLIQFRRDLPSRNNPHLTLPEILAPAPIKWHGVDLGKPDWSEHSHCVALTIESEQTWYHLIFNAYWKPVEFQIPDVPNDFNQWHRIIDTSFDAPDDIRLEGVEFAKSSYLAKSRSTILLTAKAC